MTGRFEIPLPPPNEVMLLAKKLANGNELRLRILLALIGRPHRYSELRPLLAGKGDELLNRALRSLVMDGILDRRSDVSKRPAIESYELSDLGSRVIFALAERAALERLARVAQGGPSNLADAFLA
jgi:DNA-binding HxlR family transcriptional regulator